MSAPFPTLIDDLPEVDLPIAGVCGKLLQGTDRQVVFFAIEPVGAIPPHSHGEQFGVMLEGEMDLTIGGQTQTYKKGDTYHVPAGVVHAATFRTRVRLIDVFADVDRYQPRRA